jgi:tryptophan 2,3-dioxygenase
VSPRTLTPPQDLRDTDVSARLEAWTPGSAGALPLADARGALRRTGKLRAPDRLLDALVAARDAAISAGWREREPLVVHVLDGMTDKHRGRYSYRSYAGLLLLDAVIGDENVMGALLRDLERFERRSAARRSLAIGRARAVFGEDAEPDAVTRFVLDNSVLPMSAVHDEYLFIRVLQCFEVLFARCLRHVTEARDRLLARDVVAAEEALDRASGHLRTYPALFKILTTMPPEHFLAFRDDTEGSSAIGSSRVKLLEALGRRLPAEELEGQAFAAVPDVQAACRAGMPTLEDAWERSPHAARRGIARALLDLERHYDGWRRMHLAIVRRWLGAVPGTGGTAGAAYLGARAARRLFPYVPRP